ncbi:MAG: hypothetical protein JRH18_23945 [Deltaproteobacteria bacterium]|nr:hypothetical protein [Deltaproteobacteria bacterium]MBW2154700.1 hypothetical protein [Deltaproteobacteria bacterium]
MGRDKVLDLLEAADWKDIILKLTRYALWKASRYTWRSGNPRQLIGGKTPEDIALEAVEKVWSGVRAWNPDKHPDLLRHLMGIVDSDLNHLIHSLEFKKTYNIPDSAIIDEADKKGNAEEEMISRESAEYEEQVKTKFYEMVKGDEDLEMLLICFEEGIEKAEEIAAETKWDKQKVYNLKRKLSRKIARFSKDIQSRHNRMET